MQRMTAAKFKKSIPESSELSACLAVCKQAGIVAWRSNSGVAKYGEREVRFGFKGMPDICGYVPSMGRAFVEPLFPARPFFWEVKRRGKDLSPDQRMFLQKAGDDGCVCGWGTTDDLIGFLRKEGLL